MSDLITTPKVNRIFGQDYIFYMRYASSAFYLDCRNDSIHFEYDVWTIHRSNHDIRFYVDDMEKELDVSEFLEFVMIKTPQYADALLFMLSDPKSYFDGVTG